MANITDVTLDGVKMLCDNSSSGRARTFVLKNMDPANGYEILDANDRPAGKGFPMAAGEERAVVVDAQERLWARALTGSPTVRVMRLNASSGG